MTMSNTSNETLPVADLVSQARARLESSICAYADGNVGFEQVSLHISELELAIAKAERDAIVAWIRLAPDRIKAQLASGAQSLGPLHTLGLMDGAKGLADSIETGLTQAPR